MKADSSRKGREGRDEEPAKKPLFIAAFAAFA